VRKHRDERTLMLLDLFCTDPEIEQGIAHADALLAV
jgi:hypothetical protein